jgi:phosphoglycolate phosphatase-like HAD superfamily hydrolase
MFDICLFDLDDTLVRTEDLKEVREACKDNADAGRINAVKAGLAAAPGRRIYSLDVLESIRKIHPEMKLCIFTRSPRSYARTVLEWAYPGFAWDLVVAYEDVSRTKPHGAGIDLAMGRFNVETPDKVMLVGDADVDVRAAYNCGCIAVIDRSSWPGQKRAEHWKALELVPDAFIYGPDDLVRFLARPHMFLPELERLLSDDADVKAGVRFDQINHFVPKAIGGDNHPIPIYACGRSFTNYESVRRRKQWHELTQSIEDHKDADTFSESWIKAIRHFIAEKFRLSSSAASVCVTVVPHRPGRKARLEALLHQLQQSLALNPIPTCNVTVAPDLLAFKAGVKSQHNDHLGQVERFENARDHLFVKSPQLVSGGKSVLVLDDVVTTGASLIYAMKYLKAAGAGDLKCLAIAKSVSDVL